jgi:hypothetical protein
MRRPCLCADRSEEVVGAGELLVELLAPPSAVAIRLRGARQHDAEEEERALRRSCPRLSALVSIWGAAVGRPLTDVVEAVAASADQCFLPP